MSAQRRVLGIAIAVAAAAAACTQASAETRGPAPSARPHCADFATDAADGVAGDAGVVRSTLTAQIVPAAAAIVGNPAARPFPISSRPPTPAYCLVSFTYSSGLKGPAAGYREGMAQAIRIRVAMPLSAADGGAGGVEGSWTGRQLVTAGAGFSSTEGSGTGYAEGTNSDPTPGFAIRLGYITSNTDTGQNNATVEKAVDGGFGVIQTGGRAHTLALGPIADWAYRGTHYGKVWAANLAQAYYGSKPTKVYYDGCSGGGNQGMGQLQNYGDEYDGFLIGAPAFYWQEFRLADSWPQIVFKKLVQQGNALPTTAQMTAINAAAISACDAHGADTVVDGIVADPRTCTFSAAASVCGAAAAPAAPTCITAAQAAAIDRIWDGPRNRFGRRIWFPYDKGANFGGFTLGIDTKVGPGTTQVMRWNHRDTTFDGNNLYVDAESLALAGNPPHGITYEDEAALGSKMVADYTDNQSVALDKARAHGTKVIQLHGMLDSPIRWRHDVDYYRRVATHFGAGQADLASLRSWYRLFPMPGVGHCSGGAGPSPCDPFAALVKWVEQGTAPDSIVAQGGMVANRTRPLCAYPQTAVYTGSGSTDDAANFTCSGNLETAAVLCDSVRTAFKHENEDALDFASIGVNGATCATRRSTN